MMWMKCSMLWRYPWGLLGLGWHCLVAVIKAKYHRLERKEVDYRLRRGSQLILRMSRTRYSISAISPISFHQKRSYILMSNHRSIFDLLLIFATMPGSTRVLHKKELLDIPLFGAMLKSSESIAIDRFNPKEALENFNQLREKISSGLNFLVFPEGSRSTTSALLPFKAGVFRLAKELGAIIIPLGITGTESIMSKGQSIASFGKTIALRVGTPIDTLQYAENPTLKPLMDVVREQMNELIHTVAMSTEAYAATNAGQ